MRIKHNPKAIKDLHEIMNKHIDDKTIERWAKLIHKHMSESNDSKQ